MKRWTDREGIDTKVYYDGDRQTYDSNQEEAYKKLCKILDLERELGIDLITLFKALKNEKIYVSKGYSVGAGDTYNLNDFFQIYRISYDEMTEKELEECSYYKGYENSWKITFYVQDGFEEFLYLVNVKDYGKTWSLDKQTLEKQVEER